MKKLYTQEQINWLKENVDNYYYEDLTKTFNQVFLENRSKSSIYNVLKHNKIQKTKRQMLRNQIDNENGLTFKPHVNATSPQYNKNVNFNLENKAKKLMQQKHQKMLIKNYYNYDFLQDI
jgi:predicted RNA binding protein with dsRBD fold (UPF0201 family)